jgi:cyclic pyranopterin phosphate synthase
MPAPPSKWVPAFLLPKLRNGKQSLDMAHYDAHSRPINYLRVSVTDRCNLRCLYCMPPEGIPWIPHEQVLRFEEIALVVRAAAELGITRVRLTGGEPLVRLGIVDLVRMLASTPGVEDLAMTTNGVLLTRYAQELADAGLDRVNVSLDTLRPARFHSMTRLGSLEEVLAGIEAAHRAGLDPVKLNTVVMRGTNDDDVVDLARKTREAGWNVRFIEWMPVGETAPQESAWREKVVTAEEMKKRIAAALGDLEPAEGTVGSGPARYYRLHGARGTIGFITPVSEHFCYHCNRLRLMADGHLRPCLLSDGEVDLRTPLRQGAGVEEIKSLILQAIEIKPLQHHLNECGRPENRVMSQIGG